MGVASTIRIAGFIGLSLTLTACKTTEALFDRSGYRIENIPDDVPALVDLAKTTRMKYAERSEALEKSNWYFDVPLFGLATAAVASLYYGAPNDLIGGLGIGAGAIGLSRSSLSPSSRTTGYEVGAKAMTCVFRHGTGFLGVDTDIGNLKRSVGTLKTSIHDISEKDKLPQLKPADGTTAGPKAEFLQAKSEFEAALAAANDAVSIGETELKSFNDAAHTLSVAIMQIDDQVRSLVKLKPFDFSAALSTYSASVTTVAAQQATLQTARNTLAGISAPGGTGQSQPAVAANPDQRTAFITDKLKDATKKLVTETRAITSRDTKYGKLQGDIQACPALAVVTP